MTLSPSPSSLLLLVISISIQMDFLLGNYTCELLEKRTCLGEPLDFHYTTTDLVSDSKNQKEVQDNLQRWEGLRFLPKCWSVLQPFLCGVYVPKCENSTVKLPCREQCLATREPCSVVERYYGQWPAFLNCENFPKKGCNGTIKKLKLNESACRAPLVATEHQASWYEGIAGCGIQCRNPIFSEEEHTRIHRFVGGFGALTTLCTLFTIVTFLIGWKTQSRYPSVILFFMNGCFCVASIGFMIQFSEGARHRVVCRKDDTMRLGEPSEEDSFLCLLTFVLVYYFSMAGIVWFVMLAYSWCISFKSLGSTRDNFAGKTLYFHGICWVLPACLTGCVLLLKGVDANSISGICFVGYEDANMRAGFLLGPLGLNLSIGGFFLVKGIIALFRLRKSNPNLLNSRASMKIKETIIRVGIFAFVAFAFGFITFACHLYEYHNLKEWEESFRTYLRCVAEKEVRGKTNTCKVGKRANLGVIELGLSSLFGAGIAMSSWTWTSNTFKTWKKLWHRITKKPRYPDLSHYRIIQRMRKNRVGPPAQAAVLFKHEPKLAAAFTRPEENWKRRKSKQTEQQTLQLVSAWSESTTQVDPVQPTTPSLQEGKQSSKATTEYLSKINLETGSTSKTPS